MRNILCCESTRSYSSPFTMLIAKLTYLALVALFSAQGLAAPAATNALVASGVTADAVATFADITAASISDEEEAAYTSVNPASAIFARANGNECGNSSFYRTTSSASAENEDCVKLRRSLSRVFDSKNMHLRKGFNEVVSFGTCRFGLRNDGLPYDVIIGMKDVWDLLAETERRQYREVFWGTSTRVGAKGRMRCGPTNKEVIWGIARK